MVPGLAHPPKGAKERAKPELSHPTNNVQENCTLLVLRCLRSGIRPSQIWKKYPISERSVKYVLRRLRDAGLVQKLGYGTWEVLEGGARDPTRCKIVHRVGLPHTTQRVQSLKPDTVRGHGIVATIKVPRHRFLNWNDRDQILKAREIPFISIPQGQRISVGRIEKVWLTSKSIVFYYPKGYSWFGETAKNVSGAILEDVITHARRLENLMGMDTLMIKGMYHIKFSRQHYSLIRNGLAKYYNDPRRKLEVRDDGGLWLLIDNSYNLDELENVHPRTAVADNKLVQDFFNSLKRAPMTSEQVYEMFGETSKQIKEAHGQIAEYAGELRSHHEAWLELGHQARENAKTTVSLREAVERLAESFGGSWVPSARAQRGFILAPAKVDKTPSKPLAFRMERKKCGLCGELRDIAQGKTLCEACESMLAERRGSSSTASLDNYLA